MGATFDHGYELAGERVFGTGHSGFKKAEGSLSIDPTSMSLSYATASKTITVTRAGDGAISAMSSNTNIATVSVSGTTVTVTRKNTTGSATITVSVAEGSQHLAPAPVTCSVSVTMPSTTLNSNTPATIKEVAAAGQGSSYWSVGDKIGIALSGTVGQQSINGTYYAFIIGFNHNSGKEGTGIHFQFGKTSNGTDIAFVDSSYSYRGSTAGFRMNTSDTNSGGWSSSYMRNTICSAFLNVMPTAWRNVISNCTKYTDNYGGDYYSNSVTATSDKIWLLSPYEVQGSYASSHNYEANYQARYSYYANGGSRIKKQHTNTSSNCRWWLRSPVAGYYNQGKTTTFNNVDTSGNSETYQASYSLGFAPGFKVV